MKSIFTKKISTEYPHPNISLYLAHVVNLEKGRIILYMEYFMGTLHKMLETKRNENLSQHMISFPLIDVVGMVLQIAEAISHLHNLPEPIIHRDLKSENIFTYQKYGSNVPFLKIGDFGEAKILDHNRKNSFTPQKGTTEFRAPELFKKLDKSRSDEGHNTKADVWSWGMVLYEILVLDIPYRSQVSSAFEIPNMIEKGDRPLFPTHISILLNSTQIGLKLWKLFVLSTEMNPANRIASADLVAELKEIIPKIETKEEF